MSAHAIVLIEAERASMFTLGSDLLAIPGVASVYGVTGEWDFVAMVKVEQHDQLRAVVTEHIQNTIGVARTQTLVALDVYDERSGDSE